ncbi:MAG TPA: MGMT family protein [Acidimicrobiales bacterium]|nr:MGMT family protein [Acidimicrobiales bacterium]
MARVLRALRPGEVVSYGEVAARAGFPGAARAVGSYLASRCGPRVPWWRVVRAGGRLAAINRVRQAELLASEGVLVVGGRIADPALRLGLQADLAGMPDRQRPGRPRAGR